MRPSDVSETSQYKDERYRKLFLIGMENAHERLKQGGDAHDEQVWMSYLGSTLEAARIGYGVSFRFIVDQLKVTERFILLGEKGALAPEKFFKRVDKWALLVHVSIPNERDFFEGKKRKTRE